MLEYFPTVQLIDILDILLVSFIIYWILLFIRGTRAVQILFGLLLLMALFVLSKRLGMVTFQWIVGNFLGGLIVILVVIFQSEIRRGLAKMGQFRVFGGKPAAPLPIFIDDLVRCTFRLAEGRIGAILLLEREMGLQEYVDHGIRLDAVFSEELMLSILSNRSPVHDGAVVIREERVDAAGVILPIPAETSVTGTMGTRHRAAWGVSAETDAVSVVISEETGNVTVFFDRRMKAVKDTAELRDTLESLFKKEEGKKGEGERGEGEKVEGNYDRGR